MTRIGELFERKKKNILNVYFTAGFPELESTVQVMKALQDAGADMIELGMPYSDPLADGPVIQSSSARALANGMTIQRLFGQLKNFRDSISLPVILMGYLNPVLQFGFENFCREASEAGVDGLILPDLPVFEYDQEYGKIITKYHLDFIFLVTPETSAERIRELDHRSQGFLYAVSSSSTTGSKATHVNGTDYFNRVQSMKLKNPVLVGFGIKDRQSFSEACSVASGAIIGTAFIKTLETAVGEDIPARTTAFINTIR